MPFGTEAGAPVTPSQTHLTHTNSPTGDGRHLVKVLAEAPYMKSGQVVKSEIIDVMGNKSLQFVFGNKHGAIDWSIPLSPPANTAWTQQSITGNLNQLAEVTGVVPDATKTGIPSSKYRSEGGFILDMVNRGAAFWIIVAQDRKNQKYSRFSYIEGPAVEGEEWEGPEEEPF